MCWGGQMLWVRAEYHCNTLRPPSGRCQQTVHAASPMTACCVCLGEEWRMPGIGDLGWKSGGGLQPISTDVKCAANRLPSLAVFDDA